MNESGKQGEFRVPSLRHTGFTAPYMHDGSVDTLRDVIRHYAEAKGVPALKPFALTARETNDLIVFLETLTNFRMNPWRPTLTPGECP